MSWSSPRSSIARPAARRLPLAAAWLAAGLLGAEALLSALPTLYEADSRVLLDDGAAPPDEALPRSPAFARPIIAKLGLGDDADFDKPPWEPPAILLRARSWLADRTGWRLPVLSGAPPADPVERFGERVEIGTLGKSSRILDIRARSADPRQAAAIANAVAERLGHGTLISTALPPTVAATPPRLAILLAGAAAGLAAGLAGLLLGGRDDRRFRRAEEVETATGLPVIAVVPQLDDGAAALAHVLREPGSPFTDSLRKLAGKLRSERWSPAPQVIGVCSTLPGEGRSTLAAALGRLLASEGGRVLLIDCDWRHPDLHRLFRPSSETGLTSLLVDPHIALDDVIHTDALSGLDIITAGRRNRHAVRKLISEPMRKVLASLAAGYDLVLLDMPPVTAAEETLLLSCMVEKLIFALRWRQTPRRRAVDALERLLAARGDVAGVVFTRVDLARYRKYQARPPATK